MRIYYKNRKATGIMIAGIMMLSLCACGKNTAKDTAPKINLEPYVKSAYTTATVEQGDIESVLELTLKPDGFQSKKYSVTQSDLEVDKINVNKGDKVKEGDILISFKADEIQETIDEYSEEKAQNEMLIEHYSKLMAIDKTADYSDDIASLREDIQLANLYIEEQNERLKDFQVIAEKDGTVSYVNDYLQYGFASSGETLVIVNSASADYTAVTDDDYEFKVGDVYEADFNVASFSLKVKSCEKYLDKATDKEMQTIIFEPIDDMTGISETDQLHMTIKKPVIKDVVYVTQDALVYGTDENYYVYKLNEDGNRRAVEVKTGDRVDGYVIIKEGLKAGEQVTIN